MLRVAAPSDVKVFSTPFYRRRRRCSYRRYSVHRAIASRWHVFATDCRARYRLVSVTPDFHRCLIPSGYNSYRDRQRVYVSPSALLLCAYGAHPSCDLFFRAVITSLVRYVIRSLAVVRSRRHHPFTCVSSDRHRSCCSHSRRRRYTAPPRRLCRPVS